MNAAVREPAWADAFEGGAIRRRELRLDREEAACLHEAGAQVTALAPSGDKAWYDIAFPVEK